MLGALDRSYQKQKENEERYRSVVEQATEAIFLVDEESKRFIEANAASQIMLGYAEEELLGMTLNEIIEPDTTGAMPVQRTTEHLRNVVERRYKRKNGTALPVEVSDSVISYGGRRVLCIVARDITDRKRAEMALRDLAMRDGLTGLYNRREMGRILRELRERNEHSGDSMALILFDVDHFKSVNDTYGHQVGDDVLRWIGRLATELAAPTDSAARYGGEEFAIIMPDSTPEVAYRTAESLRTTLERLPFAFEGDDDKRVLVPITISLGVAGLPDDAQTEEALIEAADRALYRAKREGRNRTLCYEQTGPRLHAVS
jgi:diguanylate cyclase (GGDEF)-like protein/PAS domain S-box-containing protein